MLHFFNIFIWST